MVGLTKAHHNYLNADEIQDPILGAAPVTYLYVYRLQVA